MRRSVTNRKPVAPDRMYGSVHVAQLINYIMLDGKKNTARRVVYDAFEIIKTDHNEKDPVAIYESALEKVGPLMEVRSRRVGGANYQVPYEVRPERKLSLALRWIIAGVRSKKGSAAAKRLADELVLAHNGEGEAIKKRENMHKQAEANKAFAHFAFNRSKKK